MNLGSVEYFSQDCSIASSILVPKQVDPSEPGVFDFRELLVEDLVRDFSTNIVAGCLIILGGVFEKSNFLFEKLLQILIT